MKHNENLGEDPRLEELTPLFFKFMARTKIPDQLTNAKIPYFEVDYYQTDKLIPYGHYKPISKIIYWEFT